MKHIVAVTVFFTAITASATTVPCSIHPKKGAPASDLPALTKVSLADAQKAALASIKAPPSATVSEGELEVEHGCLVYSFDIHVPGKPGIQEVLVDAGTGKVVSRHHETARQEAAEQAKDKAARKKSQ